MTRPVNDRRRHTVSARPAPVPSRTGPPPLRSCRLLGSLVALVVFGLVAMHGLTLTGPALTAPAVTDAAMTDPATPGMAVRPADGAATHPLLVLVNAAAGSIPPTMAVADPGTQAMAAHDHRCVAEPSRWRPHLRAGSGSRCGVAASGRSSAGPGDRRAVTGGHDPPACPLLTVLCISRT